MGVTVMRQLFILFFAGAAANCGVSKELKPSPAEDTILPVHFPFASAGDVVVRLVGSDSVHARGSIDETGHANINLRDGAGDFVVEVSHVSARELATNATAESGDNTWRVPAPGVDWLTYPDPVIITPERHIVWAAAKDDIAAFERLLAEWESVITCDNDELKGTLSVAPYIPTADSRPPTTLYPAV